MPPITDSKLDGYSAIYIKSGDLKLNGTTVDATGDYIGEPKEGKDVSLEFDTQVFDGSGIDINSDSTYTDTIPVTLSDDTVINSENGFGIRELGGKDGAGTSLVDLQSGKAEKKVAYR